MAATTIDAGLRATIDVDPYKFYDTVRGAGDVVRDEALGAWLVTSHRAIRGLMLQDKVLIRHSAASIDDPALHLVIGGPRSRLLLTGDVHAAHHRWFVRRFTHALADTWRETLLRPIVDHLIDDFAADGRVDLMAQLSDRFSVRVISAILGLPWDDDPFVDHIKTLIDRKQAYINMALVGASEDETRLALEAVDEMDALLMPFVDAARDREPRDDDILALLWSEGPSIRDDWNVEDVLAWITTTYFAGTDTTTHAIQNGLYLLMTVPGLVEQLRAGGDDAIRRYAEEVLRLYPSVHFTHRLANEDFELFGTPIATDDALFVLDAGANRDPQRYPCPGEIDLERERPREHLAFSVGPRMCAGAALARAEIQEVVARVLDRLPNLRLDPEAPAPELRGFLLRSFAPLHALFDPS